MATTVLGLKTFTASDPVDYNEVNDNYTKIDNGVKTAMQGRAAHNLLDHSDFSDLVAQAGLNGAHGSTAYIADRWKSGNATATANSGYTTISSTKKAGRIVQMLPAAVAGKTVTAAAKVASANTIYFGVYYIQNSVSKYINNSFVSPNGVIMVSGAIPADATNIEFRIYTSYIDGGGSCNVYWASLYEGSYTADTLPAYQPKGYAAELAECKRYFERKYKNIVTMDERTMYLLIDYADKRLDCPTISTVITEVYDNVEINIGIWNVKRNCASGIIGTTINSANQAHWYGYVDIEADL